MKTLESRAEEALRALLEQVPTIELLQVKHHSVESGVRADLTLHVEASGMSHILLCEVKANGQPRHVRSTLLQLQHDVAQQTQRASPVFIAPYLSADAQAMCREHSVNYLDFEGNARLLFDSVFIERQVATKPVVERRELRSLFKPKSAQVLRVMLRDPGRTWRVTDLAEAGGVSLGHVSNVRTGLLDREWAKVSEEGVFLSQPGALLDAWRVAYETPLGQKLNFYTTLHGSSFEEAAKGALDSKGQSGLAAFASFSAAHWLAPYARTGMQYFYADEAGLERLRAALKLSSSIKGENVSITVLKDDGLFRDMVNPAPGIVCTSPVQTYLDLAASGERGSEAADYLREKELAWSR